MISRDGLSNICLAFNPLATVFYFATGFPQAGYLGGVAGVIAMLYVDHARTEMLKIHIKINERDAERKRIEASMESLVASPAFSEVLFQAFDGKKQITLIVCDDCQHLGQMFPVAEDGEQCPVCMTIKHRHSRISIDGTQVEEFIN